MEDVVVQILIALIIFRVWTECYMQYQPSILKQWFGSLLFGFTENSASMSEKSISSLN